MVRQVMEYSSGAIPGAGSLCKWMILFTIWLCSFHSSMSQQTALKIGSHVPSRFELSQPPTALFDPIEISPAVMPHNPYSGEPLPPMYPSFPSTYEPVLTGRCPINFSNVSSIIDKTASDCSAPLAALVGNVICCPQVASLMRIFQGAYSNYSGRLVLQPAVAADCFSDIINILASKGANITIPALCTMNSTNLTGGSCPVKDTITFEKKVNASKLLESCSSIDPLKECCRPSCQAAIVEAALHISLGESTLLGSSDIPGSGMGTNVLSDCKGVVYAWLSKKLSLEAADTAFRQLSSCKVNKVCPLTFKEPSGVIKACRDSASPNSSCCSSLNSYIADLQKQMLITNRQAINCATQFGSTLQKGGVMTNIYELCDVDLKDFSLQVATYGQQGCLLRSSPVNIVYDNYTGFSFTCDLNDNIAAPWPSSSLSSLSLCAPEMSLPALPVPQSSGTSGNRGTAMGMLLHLLSALLYKYTFMG